MVKKATADLIVADASTIVIVAVGTAGRGE